MATLPETTQPGATPETSVTLYAADGILRRAVGELVKDTERHPHDVGAQIIAARLAEAGAHGVCGSWELCVVAQWLHDRLGGTVLVDGTHVTWLPRYGNPAKFTAPPPLQVFLRQFDYGHHPELVCSVEEAKNARQPA